MRLDPLGQVPLPPGVLLALDTPRPCGPGPGERAGSVDVEHW